MSVAADRVMLVALLMFFLNNGNNGFINGNE